MVSPWFLLGFSFGFPLILHGSSSSEFCFLMDRKFDFAPNFTIWSTMTNVKSGKVAFDVFLGFFQTSSSQPGHGRIPLNSHQTSATSLRRIPKDLLSGTWIAPETVPKQPLNKSRQIHGHVFSYSNTKSFPLSSFFETKLKDRHLDGNPTTKLTQNQKKLRDRMAGNPR